MNLYFSPFACSLASHIVCREAGVDFSLHQVSLVPKTLDDGSSFLEVTPKGQVPTLTLDNGDVLTEGLAVLQYIADQNPSAHLTPTPTTSEYYKHLEWLTFISTELHKRVFYTFFSPNSSAEAKQQAYGEIPTKLDVIEAGLAEQTYLVGETFSTADAYLGWWLILAQKIEVDLAPYENISRYLGNVLSRPSVRAALKYEGSAYEKAQA